MANINAYRMDGLGNNFLIIDRRKEFLKKEKDQIVDLVNKKALPFDQLITLEKEEENAYPIKIFNPDGIEVSACGNGVRCIGKYLAENYKELNGELYNGGNIRSKYKSLDDYCAARFRPYDSYIEAYYDLFEAAKKRVF